MSLLTLGTSITYNTTGQLSCPVPFRFLINSQIVVTRTRTDKSKVTLTEGTDYTLTGARAGTGGTVALVSALQAGESLTISRVTPKTQATSLLSQGAFTPSIHEDALDKLTMEVQELASQIAATAAAPAAITQYASVVNVKAYGAVGDGVTDDAGAITAALAAASATGVSTSTNTPVGIGSVTPIFFPAGIYKVGSTVTIPAYARLIGNAAMLTGKDSTTDIFTMQGYEQTFTGLIFREGRVQINITSALGNVFFDDCKFVTPGTASLQTTTGCNQGYFRFTRCEFLSQYGVTAGSFVNHVTGDEVLFDNCHVLTSMANPFVFGLGSVTFRSVFATPGGGNVTWIKTTNSNLRVTDSHFGGENSATMVEWHLTDDATNGIYAMQGAGLLHWTNNVCFSTNPALPSFKFYGGLPMQLVVRDIEGTLSAPYFDSGILHYGVEGIGGSRKWEIDPVSLFSWMRVWTGQASPGNVTLATQIAHRLLRTDDASELDGSELLAAGTLNNIDSGPYPSGQNTVNGGITTNNAVDYAGRTMITSTATVDGGYLDVECAAGLLGLCVQPGIYTMVLHVEVKTDHVVTGWVAAGGNQKEITLTRGKHLLHVQFTLDRVPKFYSNNLNVAQGDILILPGAYTGGVGSVAIAVQGGITAASGTPTVGSSVGISNPVSDGSTKLAFANSWSFGGGFYNAPNGAVVTVGDYMLFKGKVNVRKPKIEVVSDTLPTNGFWRIGDTVLRGTPVAGGTLGWVCTKAGAAVRGTWSTNLTVKTGELWQSTDGKVLICSKGGVTAASGSGPTGYFFPGNPYSSNPPLADNTAQWMFYCDSGGGLATFKPFGSLSSPSALNQPLTYQSGTAWQLPSTPTDPASVLVYKEGVRQKLNLHYNYDNNRTITFIAGFDPPVDAWVSADYAS